VSQYRYPADHYTVEAGDLSLVFLMTRSSIHPTSNSWEVGYRATGLRRRALAQIERFFAVRQLAEVVLPAAGARQPIIFR
jgi:hypothetical protein